MRRRRNRPRFLRRRALIPSQPRIAGVVRFRGRGGEGDAGVGVRDLGVLDLGEGSRGAGSGLFGGRARGGAGSGARGGFFRVFGRAGVRDVVFVDGFARVGDVLAADGGLGLAAGFGGGGTHCCGRWWFIEGINRGLIGKEREALLRPEEWKIKKWIKGKNMITAWKIWADAKDNIA